MALDDSNLFQPKMIAVITLLYAIFVFLMTSLFSSFAKPVSLEFYITNKTDFINRLREVSEKKWNRKVINENNSNQIYITFGNSYKDWLSSPVEIYFDDDNKCKVLIPAYYEDDLLIMR